MDNAPADDKAASDQAGGESPHLGEAEREQAAAHAAPKALVIHEVVREEGEAELKRAPGALFWSGLAAGLSMGFSLLTLAFLQSKLPDAPWRALLASPGYSVGFVITILGKQQLFTESTLTAVLPLLVRRNRETLVAVIRMWAIVLAANLFGTILIAGLFSWPGLFDGPTQAAMSEIAKGIVSEPLVPTILKAMLAGWLIALMVWVLPGAQAMRLLVIMLLTYVVALGRFPHIVAGSADAAYAVFIGQAGIGDYVFHFLLPTLFGNTLGGVALAAILNHAPIAGELRPDVEHREEEPDAG